MEERIQGPAGVLTISDKASQGKREDQSGEAAVRILEEAGFSVVKTGAPAQRPRRLFSN